MLKYSPKNQNIGLVIMVVNQRNNSAPSVASIPRTTLDDSTFEKPAVTSDKSNEETKDQGPPPSQNENRVVFIDAANDDMEEAKRVQEFLEKKGIKFIPTVTTSDGIRRFFKDLEDNLQKCDMVIVPFKNVQKSWLREHIRYYTSAQTRRPSVTPLRVWIYNPSKRHINLPSVHNLEITEGSSLTEFFQSEVG